jgi:hypothetical protein
MPLASNNRLRERAGALVVLISLGLSMSLERGQAKDPSASKTVLYGCHGEFDYRELQALFVEASPPAVLLRWYYRAQDGQPDWIASEVNRLLKQGSGRGAFYTNADQTFRVEGTIASYQWAKSASPYRCNAFSSQQPAATTTP